MMMVKTDSVSTIQKEKIGRGLVGMGMEGRGGERRGMHRETDSDKTTLREVHWGLCV